MQDAEEMCGAHLICAYIHYIYIYIQAIGVLTVWCDGPVVVSGCGRGAITQLLCRGRGDPDGPPRPLTQNCCFFI